MLRWTRPTKRMTFKPLTVYTLRSTIVKLNDYIFQHYTILQFTMHTHITYCVTA
jgi:hypothetical protein